MNTHRSVNSRQLLKLLAGLCICCFQVITALPAPAALTVRVSVDSSENQANGMSLFSSVSADGRYVVFDSFANNLVSGDTNGFQDIFLRDTLNGTTSRISMSSAGVQANGASSDPMISADGRYVAFTSSASNLVSGDTNGVSDVFIRDLLSSLTFRVSVNGSGTEGNLASYAPAISQNGDYIAFASDAANLASGDSNNATDIFVHNRPAATTVLVSQSTSGVIGNGDSRSPSISGDGRYISFASEATNLVSGDSNGMLDIFVRDRVGATTARVSVSSAGVQANDFSTENAISADGRYVAFASYATNLVTLDTNGTWDVFVHELQSGATTRMSVDSYGLEGDGSSYSLAISANGRYVAFASGAPDLVRGDTNGITDDIYMHDRQTGTTRRVNISNAGLQGDSGSLAPAISADGRYVAYRSYATNLVSGDTNGTYDIFLSDYFANTPPVAVNDTAATNEDTPVSITVLPNDSDAEGDLLTVTAVTTPPNGVATIVWARGIDYTPKANYHGTDSFSYTISDGHGGADTATVTVTVTPVNDPPVAVNDTATTNEDTPVSVAVLANDTDVDGDVLSVTAVAKSPNGTVAIVGGVTVTYTPYANYHGTDSFSYAISDSHGGADTATVTVTVAPVNDPPVAVNDTAVTNEDTPVSIAVLANDSDIDGDALSVSSVKKPANGSATIVGGTTVTYTPNANYHGTDSFQYTAGDGHGGTDSATVTVTVNSVNDPPVAVNDTAATNEDTPVSIAVLANDTDIEGDVLSVTAVTQPSNGTASIVGGSTVTYTPTANYHGTDTFSYTAGDGHGGADTATVTVTVTPVNDPPVAVNDTAATNEDTPVSIAVLANDADIDGDALSVSSVKKPANGTATIVGGTTVTYTPNANYHGTDSFQYTAGDGHGGTDSATITVTINSVNDPPVAVNDTAATNEDTPVSIAVLANDTDIEGDVLSVTAVTQPSNGTASIVGDSTVTYTPTADYHGSDTFSYTAGDGHGGGDTATVTVTVTAVNDPPVAVNDTAATNENTPVSITVLANDTDVDGDTLTVTAVTAPTNGTATIIGGVTVDYTPKTDYYGTDSFSYTINDGHGETDTAVVTVTIVSVNDPPAAVNDTAATNEDTPVSIAVLVNDTDPDGDALSVTAVTTPPNGTAVIVGGTTVTYTPKANYHGTDSFSYTVGDGRGGADTATVTVTITAVNDPPVGENDNTATNEDTPVSITVLANDTDPDGDALSVTSVTNPTNGTATIVGGTTVSYTPNTNYHGTDSFSYTINDGHGETDTAIVTVTIISVNDPPVAVDDTAVTDEETPVSIAVLANDTDIDGDALAVAAVTAPSHGIANTDGNTITYTPYSSYVGPDSFQYTVDDGHGGADTATVTITVNAINHPPVAVAERYVIMAVRGYMIPGQGVLANDTDLDGDQLTAHLVTPPRSGQLILQPDGTFTYKPLGWVRFRTDAFSYRAYDGTSYSEPVSVSLLVFGQ